ncbi:MAG TPA: lipid biosynthesis B12-binding/radical SAM protein [Candidatus Omnitrophota bacterium]|nr:lipid biosynthesis B12-binding/radical SAM protein [Candidatus Omnitrophota bacterium]
MGEAKAMKVFLISSNVASTPYSVYPLGLSMIAASLKNNGHCIEQFDFLASGRSPEALTEAIKTFQPELIGISIRNIDNVNLLNEQRYIDTVKNIIAQIRQITQVKIILGGSGFSIMPEAILEKVGADFGIMGEGEALIADFVKQAGRGVYPKEKIIRSNLKLADRQIPSACYDSKIMQFYLQSGNVASVQTKRGCEHKCVYCSYPILEGAVIRTRDVKAVVDDIQNLVENFGAKYLFFTDSVFNDEAGNYLKLLEEIKRRKLVIPWSAFFKPQGLTEKAAGLMQETGLKAAEMGADACTDTTLKKLGKSFLFKDVIQSNALFAKFNIATAHYFMFGCPGETQATVIEGINNIKSLAKTASFMYMGIRILPGTPLEQLATREKLIKPGQNLLEPVYYIAPGLDRKWLEETLTEGFKGIRHCVFPPDALDSSLAFLHKLGYSGSLWEMLIPGNAKRNRKKQNVEK